MYKSVMEYWTVSPKNLNLINIGWNCKKVPCDIYVSSSGKTFNSYDKGFKRLRRNPFSRYIK